MAGGKKNKNNKSKRSHGGSAQLQPTADQAGGAPPAHMGVVASAPAQGGSAAAPRGQYANGSAGPVLLDPYAHAASTPTAPTAATAASTPTAPTATTVGRSPETARANALRANAGGVNGGFGGVEVNGGFGGCAKAKAKANAGTAARDGDARLESGGASA